MGDRQRQITELYHAALARDGPERAAFLREACVDDDALRREVESLLGYEDAAAPFLERPAIEHVAPLAANHPEPTGDLVGRRLGSYQIEARIGAGGMGEVYRARDTKLGRDVAIKVLPTHLMADADRRARFDREARVLATLNHSNIAQIYGLEESAGLQALVMELVPGETLDRMIKPPPHGLRVEAALAFARQIADAVDAAHERGVIHRDLKPANIVVTPAGAVKVLDFGLAKATTGDASSPDLSQSPTITAHGPSEGLIIGTPAYMSPEQARGRPLDKRSDIWAFGCVLFEMLSGRRAFSGETTADTIAAILEREPDWSALPQATPATIRRLLQRCLERDSTRRLRDIGDARAEIDDAIAFMLEAQRTTRSVQATSKPGGWLGPRAGWLVTALVAVIIALAVVPWQWRPSGAPDREPELSRLTSDPGLQTDPALSPDGQLIAYTSSRAGNFDVWVQQVGGGNPIQVTKDPAHDWQPDWSPNGDQLVFRSEREGGGLMVVPALGGAERRVSSFGYRPRWSADGSQILFLAGNVIGPAISPYTVKLDGQPPRPLGVGELEGLDRQGAWGWNRKGGVTFLAGEASPDFAPRLSTVDLQQGTTIRSVVDERVRRAFHEFELTIVRAPLAWAPDGTAIYFVGESKGLRNLWAINIEPSTFAVTGGPRRLTTMAEANSYPSISTDGQQIAFGAATGYPRLWSYALNQAGTEVSGAQALTPAEMGARTLDLSADGAKMVFAISRPGSSQGQEIHVTQMSNGAERTLNVEAGASSFLWSRDGALLAYRYIVPGSAPKGQQLIWRGSQHIRILDTRTGVSNPLTSPVPLGHRATGWSPDGRFVISVGHRFKDQAGHAATKLGFSTVALVPVSAAPTAETAAKVIAWSTDRLLYQGSMSPNSKWVCFIAFDPAGGGSQIVVVASEGGDWRRVPSQASFDDKPRWSADGRLLYFVSDRGGLYNVWAERFDPAVGKLIGDPFQVTRFAGPGEMIDEIITPVEIGVAPGRLVLPLVTPSGGIWMLDGIASAPAVRTLGWRLSIVLAALAIALIAMTKGLSTRTVTVHTK